MYKRNRKWIKIFWAMFAANVIAGLSQAFFAYGHVIKHEWLLMAVSSSIFLMNVYVARNMFRNVKQIKANQRQSFIDILSGKGEWA